MTHKECVYDFKCVHICPALTGVYGFVPNINNYKTVISNVTKYHICGHTLISYKPRSDKCNLFCSWTCKIDNLLKDMFQVRLCNIS